MKVTIVSESFAPENRGYGDIVQLKRLEKSLKLIGVDATFIPTVGNDDDSPIKCDRVASCSESCIDCPMALEQSEGYLARLRDKALKTDADIYHIRGNRLYLQFPDNVIRVITGVSMSKLDPKHWSANSERPIFESADAVTVLNAEGVKFFIGHYGIVPDYVPIPADDIFNPDVEKSLHFGDRKVIGYVGNMNSYQFGTKLLDSVALLKRYGVDPLLLLVLNKPQNLSDFLHRAKVLGMRDNVMVLTDVRQEDMPGVIQSCDVLHLVRDIDNSYPLTPVKLLDYMAMEKPFIYSDADKGVMELWVGSGKVKLTDEDYSRKLLDLLNVPGTDGMRKMLEDSNRTLERAGKLAKEVYEVVLNG